MPETTRGGQRRVELVVRDDLPEPVESRLERLSARLDQLVAASEIDSYARYRWSKHQSFDAAESRYVSFREWARDAGVQLSPGFDSRACYSMVTGECEQSLVVPVVCLAVYDGDEIEAVYPHVGAEPRTVADGLAALSGPVHDSLPSTPESGTAD
ncbi:HTH domain-containing protein [Halapricum salinum]|uniref:Uncharacterized protein n=1 Tax=Halapricum salinum TaxID=1457250 RepID=A0A4D6H807_9EURY|nr:HTH domain-containing protein [Halapricum salinum]QCC49963.1 hypothetical protein DV733_01425 [Halapricum salinum]